MAEILSDYAGNLSVTDYEFFEPQTQEILIEKISIVYRDKTPIRIRANGHSMNSLAVPRQGELLVSMKKLCRYIFNTRDTVTVEAGAAVWDVNLMLKEYGYELLVYNDGNAAASSVGGYLSAGGIGYTSSTHGGFWNTVEEVTLLSANGEIFIINRSHPVFKWLFGSMGQLGIILQVTLKIKPVRNKEESKNLIGEKGVINVTSHDWESIVWFTLFVPSSLWKTARRQLVIIGKRHKEAWSPRVPYVYHLPFHEFNPPLIHTFQGDLVAVGLWGGLPKGSSNACFDWNEVAKIEKDIQELVKVNVKLYRRYIQTENTSPSFYGEYFDKNVLSAFSELKAIFDPEKLFVSGVL